MLLINARQSLKTHNAVNCLNSIRQYSHDETTPEKTDEAKKDVAKKKLNELLEKMVKDKVTHSKARLELAKPKQRSGFKSNDKPKSVITERVDVIKKAAASVGGDVKHVESELLSKLLNCSTPEQSTDSLTSLSDIVKGMRIDRSEKPETTSKSQQIRQILHRVDQKSTIKRDTKPHKQTIDYQTSQNTPIIPIDLFSAEPFGIFTRRVQTSISGDTKVAQQLSTWDTLHKRELRLAVTYPPRSYFQQMIQWTNQGKLWQFPIDNEQGMDEEHAVGFNEHVFLDVHLEPWCPPRGPIRQFMELVCVGMSKNPYMSARTKKEHIFWYRDYFAGKQQLLEEVGAIIPAGQSVDSSVARSNKE